MLEMADLPSDPNFERFGSIEISAAGVDESSEISQRAIEVLFSRIRWKVHETLKVSKMLMTTNPTTNWIRPRFVQYDDGNKVTPREGEYYVPFSVFDNPDIAFRQTYEAALHKISDPATKERLLYGNWDFVESNSMAIYNRFDGARHLVTNLKEQVYDPSKPLVTVWDFNVAPQMSVLTAQLDYDNKRVYVLDEVLGKPEEKENNTPALSRKVKAKLYRDKHIGGVDVTGDPSGLQCSTTSEDGVNNFTVYIAHCTVMIIGAVKKMANTLTLTKKGEAFLTDKPKLAAALIETMTGGFDAANLKRYGGKMACETGVGFILLLLGKYGADKRPAEFYADKYFGAFVPLREERHDLYSFTYTIFEIKLSMLGVVDIEESRKYTPAHEIYITKTALFDKLFICRPPRFIFNVGKS